MVDTADDRVSRVTDLLKESSLGRWSFINQAYANDTMYLGHIPENETPLAGLSYILINKTNQAIVSHAQIQVETRPRIRISARQTKSLPDYWMNRQALMSIKAAIESGDVPAFEESGEDDDLLATEDVTPTEVESQGFVFEMLDSSDATAFRVNEAFIQRIQPLLAQWQTASGELVEPLLKPTDIVMVDDTITASVVQNNIDIAWEYDDRDLWLRNNIVNCLKFGTQGVQFVFDDESKRTKWFDINILNLFLPPNCTGIKDAEYVIVREIVSSQEAKERFPYAKKEIEAYQQRGTSSMTTMTATMDTAPYQGQYFGREMVELWHIWLRNERFPMSVTEAIDNGRVIIRDGVIYKTDNDYKVTEEVVEEGVKGWPKKLGIRYQQMIGNTMVYDERCAHVDIPVSLNQNVPVSYSPWHQGEPERLWFVQKMIDKISSIILDHITYFRSPQQILPASVYKRLKGLNAVYSHPARDAWIDDTTFDSYREFFLSGRGFYIDPPNMPDKYVELWQLAMQLFDDLSGHAGVLQGRAPGANSSGKVVEDLQNAARATVSFKAACTEAMLRNLAILEIDAWSKWMPLFMWKKANDEFEIEILSAIRERSRELEFNIVVEVASGGGQLRKQKQAQAFEEVASGLRSPQSYRRLAEVNDDSEWDQQQEAAAQAAQQPQPAPKAA